MTTPADMNLYNKIKKNIFTKNPINSAYRSGLLVKQYKEQGGTFEGNRPKTKEGLSRWFRENWKDIGGKNYPVYRPTKRISKKTPLLVSEIDSKDLKKKIKQKQIIKEKGNLQPFQKRT